MKVSISNLNQVCARHVSIILGILECHKVLCILGWRGRGGMNITFIILGKVK